MKYYIIAGEASGDLHGSNLINEIKKHDSQAAFRVWGGDKMQEASGNLVMHYRDHAIMGFTAVVANIGRILRNIKFCYSDIDAYKPDVVILIDYPGFNLKIARYAHQAGLKVYYYISPKVWAWNEKRVHKIKAYVDRMFTIFPFETQFFKNYQYDVDYVGNPILDAVVSKVNEKEDREAFCKKNNLDQRKIIALLAGSRKDEIRFLLPEMLKVSKLNTDYQFVIAGAPSISDALYEKHISGSNVKVLKDRTYDLLKYAEAALVTSGTATLETALFRLPQVVCFKMSALTFFVAKNIVRIRIKFFSLVNIIMDKEVVKELLQDDLADRMNHELQLVLHNKAHRKQMLDNYEELISRLGETGASQRAAKLIVDSLKEV